MAAKDPYRYFRIEAVELLDGLAAQLRAIGSGEEVAAAMAKLLRFAHTLKGASRVVKAVSMAEAAHALETLLAPFRDQAEPPPIDTLDQAAQVLQGLRADLARLGEASTTAQPEVPAGHAQAGPAAAHSDAAAKAAAAKPAAAKPTPGAVDSLETLRVEVAQLDRLLESIAEAGLPIGEIDLASAELLELAQSLEQSSGALREQRVDQLSARLRQLSGRFNRAAERTRSDLDGLRRDATELRLLPARLVLEPLQKTLDDACSTLGKSIRLHTGGSEFRLDAHVLLPLRDALIQLVRNAASHGIEDVPTRRAAGKPAEGQIEVSLSRHGDRIRFHVRDDGGGIDLDSVRAAAVSKGRLSPEQAAKADESQLFRLLLDGGLSTAREITAIAGRGVGLDLVREAVGRARGELSIRNQPGLGCEFLIDVPPSLVALDVLVVESGRLRACVPLHNVRRALRMDLSAIEHVQSGQQVVIEQQVVKLRSLESFHSRAAEGEARAPSAACNVLLLGAGDITAALQVDRLLATREAVIRPLPAVLGRLPLVAGASPDLNGEPLPIFNPEQLIQAILNEQVAAPSISNARVVPPILVIDDSLTTRMMEQSILESAGYQVDLADCAEKAFEMARVTQYGLFVCDVEMPGMSGFEFVRLSREDAELRHTPVVLVTSLSKPEERQRGLQLGAAEFIVKSEFEQNRFLSVVAKLMS